MDRRNWNVRFAWMGCYWSLSEFKYLGCVLDEKGTDNAVLYRSSEWKECTDDVVL